MKYFQFLTSVYTNDDCCNSKQQCYCGNEGGHQQSRILPRLVSITVIWVTLVVTINVSNYYATALGYTEDFRCELCV